MRQPGRVVAAIVYLGLAISCSGGGGGGGGGGDGGIIIPPTADISGTWDMNWNEGDKPRIEDTGCSSGTTFVFYLELQISQANQTFTATAQPVYSGYVFSMTGSISGDTVTGTLKRTDGAYTDLIQFTASVSGDTMHIYPTSMTTNYYSGACDCAGEWIATRL